MPVCLAEFLGALAKLFMSARMEQLGSHWKNFLEILYLSIFQNPVSKIEVSLEPDKNNEYFFNVLLTVYHCDVIS
jgi:hypothetical protein